MSVETILLGVLLGAVSLIGALLVFRRGSNDSIDTKRLTEIQRLDKRIDEQGVELQATKDDLASVKTDSRIVATLAIRAVRWIEDKGGASFAVTEEERDALERTRPAI